MPKSPSKRKMVDTEMVALKAVANHFETLGWNMVIARFACIEQNGLKNNFRLVIEFTGGKKP